MKKKPAAETPAPADRIYFSMEYQSGSGDDWTQRKASVHNRPGNRGGYVLYTSTVGLNHAPRYFADMGKAILAGMEFAQAARDAQGVQ